MGVAESRIWENPGHAGKEPRWKVEESLVRSFWWRGCARSGRDAGRFKNKVTGDVGHHPCGRRIRAADGADGGRRGWSWGPLTRGGLCSVFPNELIGSCLHADSKVLVGRKILKKEEALDQQLGREGRGGE